MYKSKFGVPSRDLCPVENAFREPRASLFTRHIPSGKFFEPFWGDYEVVAWPHPHAAYVEKTLWSIQDLRTWMPPSGIDEALRRHCIRLKECLVYWETLPIKRYGNGIGILRANLRKGPEFADELDELYKGILRWSAGLPSAYGDEESVGYARKISSLDEVFPPRLLIPFKRPDLEDVKLLFEKRPKIEQPLLDAFRVKIREYAHEPKEKFFEFDDVDRMSMCGVSVTFDPKTKRRVPRSEMRAKNDFTLDTTNRFVFGHVQVMKNAAESRDCVVPTIETQNTMRLMTERMKQVISHPSDVIRKKEFSFLKYWLKNDGNHLYIMSDQKKCGLTFPLELVETLYDELNNLFPGQGFNLVKEGYQNAMIWYNGQWSKINNGTGLGMMVESVSLIMALLFDIWKEFQKPEWQVAGYFYNDDQVIRVNYDCSYGIDTYEVDKLAASWDACLTAFGLTVHKKKPFISRGGILLEIYGFSFPVKVDKRMTYVGLAFNALVQPTIAAAKEYFAGIHDWIYDEERKILQEYVLWRLVSYFGFEFHNSEINMPLQAGGWYRHRCEDGLDLLFPVLEDSPAIWRVFYLALKTEKIPSRKVKMPEEFKRIRQVKNWEKWFSRFSADLSKEFSFVNHCTSGLVKRARSKEWVAYWKRTAAYRQQAWAKANSSFDLDVSLEDHFFQDMFSRGANYAPPRVVYHNRFEIPYLVFTEDENLSLPGDINRVYWQICQDYGLLDPRIKIRQTTRLKDTNALLAVLVSQVPKPLLPTPLTVYLCITLGAEYVDKLTHHALTKYGQIYFPRIPLPDEFKKFFGQQDDRLIFLHRKSMITRVLDTVGPTEYFYDRDRQKYEFLRLLEKETEAYGVHNEFVTASWKKFKKAHLYERYAVPPLTAEQEWELIRKQVTEPVPEFDETRHKELMYTVLGCARQLTEVDMRDIAEGRKVGPLSCYWSQEELPGETWDPGGVDSDTEYGGMFDE